VSETRVVFARETDKGVYLDGSARVDALRPELVALVARLRAVPYEQRARLVFAFVRRRVHWREDAGGQESFADAWTVLRDGVDDCDGSARALVALALAAGLEARIRGVMKGEHISHFQAELRWPGSERFPLADAAGWVLAETTLCGVELGEGSEASEDGKRL
jgi:transglutaminase-like putative cysteine protease